MSFSPEWLALREPADHASVNAQLRDRLHRHFADRDLVRVVDLGCGAGSNLRGTSSVLDGKQHWTLVDYDPTLLATAKARIKELKRHTLIDVTYRKADLSTGDFGTIIDGADLVTAAALFDLISVPVIEKLAAAIAERKQTFYTVLTYDGIAAWLPSQTSDNDMRNAFNGHQRGNKGFGPAAGPAATDALQAAFEAHGYTVFRGHSPWILDARHGRLRRDLDAGFAAAVAETNLMPSSVVSNWIAAREQASNPITIIGHEDLLAVPT